ncbi:hypothetical protein CAP36_14920 [Chitinophagaceae bacterium IBVUCB2]|nr:hypothetical protein CAP36_14920 [Chitinophagaceae bacterium IBVUCB2]
MKRKLFTTLLFILFLIAAQGQNQGDTSSLKKAKGMIVLPSMVYFNLTNGQSATREITITNRLPEKKQYKVYLGDWERDSMGDHKYSPANSISRSCARWIKLSRDVIELEPDSSAVISVRMQMPDSAEAIQEMKWAMVFIQLVNEEKAHKTEKDITQQVIYNFRMGVHVYQTPPNLKRVYLSMLSFKNIVNKKDSILYQIACLNEGTQQLKVKCNFIMTNLSTGEKTKLPQQDFPMFPGQKRLVNYLVPNGLKPGKYSILATADGGDDMPLQASQAEVDIQ